MDGPLLSSCTEDYPILLYVSIPETPSSLSGLEENHGAEQDSLHFSDGDMDINGGLDQEFIQYFQ